MAGYPYAGGMYGGASDPTNNKKKSFVGPEVDQAAKATNPLAAGVNSGVQRNALGFAPGTDEDQRRLGAVKSQARQALGMLNPFREPGAAPVNKQATVPLSPGQTAPNPAIERMQGNTGLSRLGTPTPAQKLSQSPPQPLNDGQQVGQTARQMLASNPSPPPTATTPFRSTLASGITYEGDTQGNRTYTMGAPGQDGYGRMTVSPGTGQRSAAANQLAAGVQRPNNGYEVSGPQDAVARFNRPVSNPGNPAPDALNGGSRAAMIEQQTAQQRLAATPQAPKYMTKEEGIAAGVGWKARGQLYAQQMDAYNKATGNQNALDVEQMREGGAGARAMLAAQGINDRNAIEREGQQSANEIARKRLTGELALNDTRIGTEQLGQQKGQMEIDAAKRTEALHQQYLGEQDPEKSKILGNKILTMNGKFADKPTYQTIKEDDGQGGMRERVFRLDGDRMTEINPTITAADIARQKILLQGMKGDERKKHLQDLARLNPTLFDTLSSSTNQQARPVKTMAAPSQPSYGQLMP